MNNYRFVLRNTDKTLYLCIAEEFFVALKCVITCPIKKCYARGISQLFVQIYKLYTDKIIIYRILYLEMQKNKNINLYLINCISGNYTLNLIFWYACPNKPKRKKGQLNVIR